MALLEALSIVAGRAIGIWRPKLTAVPMAPNCAGYQFSQINVTDMSSEGPSISLDAADFWRMHSTFPAPNLPICVRHLPACDSGLRLRHACHEANLPHIEKQAEVPAFRPLCPQMRRDNARTYYQLDHSYVFGKRALFTKPPPSVVPGYWGRDYKVKLRYGGNSRKYRKRGRLPSPVYFGGRYVRSF